MYTRACTCTLNNSAANELLLHSVFAGTIIHPYDIVCCSTKTNSLITGLLFVTVVLTASKRALTGGCCQCEQQLEYLFASER